MTTFSRVDTSVVGRWWWTVDRGILLAIALLITIGTILGLAASPAVANRLGLDSHHFVQRQIIYLFPAIVIMLGVSLLAPVSVRRLAAVMFLVLVPMMVLTLIVGAEIKGSRRWLRIASLTLQPSEFLKPAFIVVSAWMLAEGRSNLNFPGIRISAVLYGTVIGLLLLQPDFGQTALISVVWLVQLFIAGMPWFWVWAGGLSVMMGGFVAYSMVGHVASRINRFFDPGGLFGRGPGEGVVKQVLPDAHTDFIFAVAGEEFGLFVCLFIAALFAFVVLRGISRLMRESNLFIVLAASGLLVMFGLQAMINIGVNLNLLPSKGMTLPFISYGGSSLLALAIAMGMVLAMTRNRTGVSVARGNR
ncbi:MAG TPA: cell division protein FtsW [Sneathiellales bacterium]|nr:cell division protein FtsW [Sneathiellales bacterium]